MQKRILVVEDDESLRELLCRSLARLGFETIQASNGEEALECFRSTPGLDAAVTDYLMPKMDGAELIRRIKEDHPAFPVVLVTGEAPDTVILQLTALPEVITLLKPFRPETLRSALRSVLHEPLPEGRVENRKSMRVDVAISCSISERAPSTVAPSFGSVRNLSFGGCFVQTDQPKAVGSVIRFQFQGLERYELLGRVAWAGLKGMGIALIPHSEEAHLFFKKFALNKLKQKDVGMMGANSALAEAERAFLESSERRG